MVTKEKGKSTKNTKFHDTPYSGAKATSPKNVHKMDMEE